MTEVWLFSGTGARFSSGVFSDKERAILWIGNNKLSGVLTKYPLDIGVYDWAVAGNLFSPRKDHEFSAEFIQRFTSSSQEHYHFEDGILE
ncbi:DUF7710 domain-containing protein [Chitinimonas sp.]|uniref:DUF7710 domain-containing protein n=1 Tax=Chitinimonas sp. TaxID=1934313 RepID=UPI003BB8DC3F